MDKLLLQRTVAGKRLSQWGCLMLVSFSVLGQDVVVVNAQNPTGSMTKDQVSNIFLGKAKNFPGGGGAIPVNLPDTSDARKNFDEKVIGRSSAQVKAYWAKMSFTGKGEPPKERLNFDDMKKALKSDSSLVGYLDKSAVDSKLKVVYEVD